MRPLLKSNLSADQQSQLRKRLTVDLPVFQSDRTERKQFFSENDAEFIVPRFFPSSSPVPVPSAAGAPCLTFAGVLEETERRPQIAAFQAVLRQLHALGGALLVLPPGAGKTNIGLAIACELSQERVLVIAHTDFLLNQWRERIHEFVPGAVVGHIQSDTCQYENCHFVLVSMKSLLTTRSYPTAALRCGLLIVDEAHHSAADGYFRAVNLIEHRYSLGLTASPARGDGLGFIVEWLLGPCAFYRALPPNAATEVNLITFEHGKQRSFKRAGRWDASRTVTALCSDETRNQVIVRILNRLWQKHPERKGLLFTHRKQHLRTLYGLLGEEKAEIISGAIRTDLQGPDLHSRPTKKGKREAIRFNKFVTLSTYHFLSEGIDFPGDFLLFATPVPEITQCSGRIGRKPGNFHPLIIDIVDPFGGFVHWKRLRCAHYARSGYHVHSFPDSVLPS